LREKTCSGSVGTSPEEFSAQGVQWQKGRYRACCDQGGEGSSGLALPMICK
jgi:hypothetical protein